MDEVSDIRTNMIFQEGIISYYLWLYQYAHVIINVLNVMFKWHCIQVYTN